MPVLAELSHELADVMLRAALDERHLRFEHENGHRRHEGAVGVFHRNGRSRCQRSAFERPTSGTEAAVSVENSYGPLVARARRHVACRNSMQSPSATM